MPRIASLILVLTLSVSLAQTTLWSETFSGSNNCANTCSISDAGGNWTMTASSNDGGGDRAGEYSGVFQIRDMEFSGNSTAGITSGGVFFTTSTIDITNMESIELDIEIWRNGDMEPACGAYSTNDDAVQIDVRFDGGAYTNILELCNLDVNLGTSQAGSNRTLALGDAGIRTSMQIRIRAGNWANTEDIFWDNMTVTATPVVPTPVEGLHFTAQAQEAMSVALNWSTTLEINNFGYEVQRRSAQQAFETTTFVPAYSPFNEGADYQATDVVGQNGLYYYRLKQIDLDGKFDYSNTVLVLVEDAGTYQLLPNPAKAATTLSWTGEAPAKVEIINMQGQTVSTHRPIANSSSLPLPLSTLAAGSYYLRLQHASGVHKQLRLIHID